MRRAYEALLWLYPPDCRKSFAREMARVFDDAAEDYRTHGVASRCRFLCAELAGIIAGAAGEWLRFSVRRLRRARPLPVILTAIAGLVATGMLQTPVNGGLTHPMPGPPPQSSELAELLVGLAIGVVMLAFPLAWNLHRSIWSKGRTAGRRAANPAICPIRVD